MSSRVSLVMSWSPSARLRQLISVSSSAVARRGAGRGRGTGERSPVAQCSWGARPEPLGSGQVLEALTEAAGVGLLGAGQRLQPLGDVLEALVAGGLGEAGVHLG